MHEYRLEDKQLTQMNIPQDTYVVCVLFKKDGPGPRNGAQYGAPFKEDDWSDKEDHTDVLAANNPANLLGPGKETSLAVVPSRDANKDCFGGMISDSCISDSVPATATATTSELPHLSDVAYTPVFAAPLLDPNGTTTQPETLQAPNTDNDDLYSMLDLFVDEDEYLRFTGPNNNEVRLDPAASAPVYLDEEDIFRGLPDLSNMYHNNNNSIARTPTFDPIENSELYLELQDLTTPLSAQTGNLDSSNANQGHNFGFSAAPANDDPSGFTGAANDYPYGFPPSMGHGPDL